MFMNLSDFEWILGGCWVDLGTKRRLEGHRAPKKPPGRVLGTSKGAKGRFCTWLREPDFEYYRGRRAKIEGSREAPVGRTWRPWLGGGSRRRCPGAAGGEGGR